MVLGTSAHSVRLDVCFPQPLHLRTGAGMGMPFTSYVRRSVAPVLLVFICYAAVFFYILGYGRSAGIPRTDLFFTIATIMMVVVRLFGSALFDKFDKRRMAAWCLVILATAFLFLPYGREWGFYFLASIFGLGWGALMPLVNAMVFDASAPHLRGVNLNLTLVAMQGGFFLGPFAGGLILDNGGYCLHSFFLKSFEAASTESKIRKSEWKPEILNTSITCP